MRLNKRFGNEKQARLWVEEQGVTDVKYHTTITGKCRISYLHPLYASRKKRKWTPHRKAWWKKHTQNSTSLRNSRIQSKEY